MSPQDNTLFTQEQEDKVIRAIMETIYSKYKNPSRPPSTEEIIRNRKKLKEYYKPQVFDYSNPETLYQKYWHDYLTYIIIHSLFSDKNGTKRHDTKKQRKKIVGRLELKIGRTPKSSDLMSAFPNLTKLDDEICQIIDKDIKQLSSG